MANDENYPIETESLTNAVTINQTNLAEGSNPAEPEHSQRKLNRKYHCVDCNSFTFEPRTYLEHRQQIHGETITIHGCLVCNYASRHANKVSRHMKMVHHLTGESLDAWKSQSKMTVSHSAIADTNSGPAATKIGHTKVFKCTICNQFETVLRNSLMDHVRENHPHIDIHNCDICNYSHYIKDRFRRHVKYHKMEKIHCEKCDFETVYKWNMERHMKHHTVSLTNTFSCDVCGYSATAKQSITAHKMTHHFQSDADGHFKAERQDRHIDDESNYTQFLEGLQTTGATSSIKKNTVTNSNVHDDRRSFENYQQFDENLASNCLQVVLKEEIGTKESEYTESPRSTINQSPLHGIDNDEMFATQSSVDSRKTYSAITAQSSITNTKHNNTHRQTTFSLDGLTIQIFKCPYCLFIVQEHSLFHRHFIGHSKSNQYSCSTCDFAGRFAWDVRRHIIATHKDANIMNFSQQSNRLYHRNYSEYVGTLVISEKALDSTTIVADINLKTKNNQKSILLGQYLSLNASLVANNENDLDTSLKDAFNSDNLPFRSEINLPNTENIQQFSNMRYRCGICHQKSGWKHVIEVSLNH